MHAGPCGCPRTAARVGGVRGRGAGVLGLVVSELGFGFRVSGFRVSGFRVSGFGVGARSHLAALRRDPRMARGAFARLHRTRHRTRHQRFVPGQHMYALSHYLLSTHYRAIALSHYLRTLYYLLSTHYRTIALSHYLLSTHYRTIALSHYLRTIALTHYRTIYALSHYRTICVVQHMHTHVRTTHVRTIYCTTHVRTIYNSYAHCTPTCADHTTTCSFNTIPTRTHSGDRGSGTPRRPRGGRRRSQARTRTSPSSWSRAARWCSRCRGTPRTSLPSPRPPPGKYREPFRLI